jgi:hypothetical protein
VHRRLAVLVMSEDRDVVRVEWDGNKYYMPRSELVRKRRGAWVAWAALAVLFMTYVLAINVVIPWLVIGRP